MYQNDVLIPGIYGSYAIFTYDSRQLAIFFIGYAKYYE